MFNCAVFISSGRILGIVPKTYLCNNNEYFEERWFSSEFDRIINTISINGEEIPIGGDLLFSLKESTITKFGIEICEDLWVIKPPSFDLSIAGASLIFNLSASNEYLGKTDYRRDLVRMQSARCHGAYIYASSNANESTTDTVFLIFI